jgi:Xaa-Pro aminopeptidase
VRSTILLYVSRLALFALLATCLCAADSEFQARRDRWRAIHPDTTLVLIGGIEASHGDIRTGFFQETNFYYLSGWNEPGAVLLVGPTRADDTLFLPKRDPVRERYTGRKIDSADADAPTRTGFPKVGDAAAWKSKLPKAELWGLTEQKAALPRKSKDATLALAQMRMVKSPFEIAAIQHSTDVTIAAHRAGWRAIAEGVAEYRVASAMAQIYFDAGCERHAYAPIVGAGSNAAILHYNANKRHMDSGELVLMDVGAECNWYATDITRTVPVTGHFTPRQRELYEVVLGAQQAAIAAARPGMMLRGDTANSLERIAKEYIATHGKDLHGDPFGKYFTHGLGHHVGLDVHDATDPALPLAPGQIVTIEPGLYIPEENLGIRIEDMILITETGARVMSAALPKSPADIEAALAH